MQFITANPWVVIGATVAVGLALWAWGSGKITLPSWGTSSKDSVQSYFDAYAKLAKATGCSCPPWSGVVNGVKVTLEHQHDAAEGNYETYG